MLHIIYDSGYFKTMVAIPVNKKLPGNENFLLKKLDPGENLSNPEKGIIYNK